MDKNNLLAVLLPTGSESETARGISHLYEHLLLAQINTRAPGLLWGHTTEDYIVLFFEKLSAGEIIPMIRGAVFGPDEMGRQYKKLQAELHREKENKDEAFFRFLWQGSRYERSPLGDIREIFGVTPGELEAFRDRLSQEDWYYFTAGEGVQAVTHDNEPESGPEALTAMNQGARWRKDVRFNGKTYDICYFSRDIEEMVLVRQMLKSLNPGRHIRLSEKKKCSALIMEKGICYPDAAAIPSLKEESLQVIHADIEEIKQDFESMAVNRLESEYFYGISWEERIDKLNRTPDEPIRNIFQRLSDKK